MTGLRQIVDEMKTSTKVEIKMQLEFLDKIDKAIAPIEEMISKLKGHPNQFVKGYRKACSDIIKDLDSEREEK